MKVEQPFVYYFFGDERLCGVCLAERGLPMESAERSEWSDREGLCIRGHYVERRGTHLIPVATR